jgi:protein-tyrosine phosphatase
VFFKKSRKSITSVLFVCLGNICRSPTAEAVFRHKVKDSGLSIFIDSAGTQGYKEGASPDKRSQVAGNDRGYDFAKIKCRKVVAEDFVTFDYIIAMDKKNLDHLMEMCPVEYQYKVSLFMSHTNTDKSEVPDPYYSGKRGFEYVLDLIEQASDGLLEHIKNRFAST